MRLRTIPAAAALILAMNLSACNWIIKEKEDTAGPKPASPSDGITYRSVTLFDENADKTRGDMEQLIWLEARLPKDYTSPAVSVSEMEDDRDRLNMVTIDVEEPFPPNLPVEIRIRTDQHWVRTPVVLRTQVLIDDTIKIGAFNALIAERARDGVAASQQFDVLAPLDRIPDTMLVIAKSESLLMPFDTDPATVDPATAETPPERISSHISNPVRINFKRRSPGAETGGEEAPAADESGAQESGAELSAQ